MNSAHARAAKYGVDGGRYIHEFVFARPCPLRTNKRVYTFVASTSCACADCTHMFCDSRLHVSSVGTSHSGSQLWPDHACLTSAVGILLSNICTMYQRLTIYLVAKIENFLN